MIMLGLECSSKDSYFADYYDNNSLEDLSEDQTDKIIQSKVLKEHSICHLLLTVSGLSKSKLELFVKKMQKSYGYSLYAAYRMGDQPPWI
uniref:Uncharacterized protein n=1 Tax=Meloidogyne javanica TaxID=6303 RepID=A0A915LJ14_MELJA